MNKLAAAVAAIAATVAVAAPANAVTVDYVVDWDTIRLQAGAAGQPERRGRP